MAVRTAYDAVAGTTLTATNLDKYPGGWIGYVEVTANQNGIGASPTDLTSLTLTVTVGTSRRLRVSARARVEQNTSGGLSELRIMHGAAQIATWTEHMSTGTITTFGPAAVVTPSSGSNTFKLTLLTTGGTIDLEASASAPGWLLVEDIGPSA